MARLLGFSSKVLQSSQSRNFDAFLAGKTLTAAFSLIKKAKGHLTSLLPQGHLEPDWCGWLRQIKTKFLVKMYLFYPHMKEHVMSKMWVFEDKLTKTELPTFTELGILSLVHISGLTLWTLKEKRRADQHITCVMDIGVGGLNDLWPLVALV